MYSNRLNSSRPVFCKTDATRLKIVRQHARAVEPVRRYRKRERDNDTLCAADGLCVPCREANVPLRIAPVSGGRLMTQTIGIPESSIRPGRSAELARVTERRRDSRQLDRVPTRAIRGTLRRTSFTSGSGSSVAPALRQWRWQRQSQDPNAGPLVAALRPAGQNGAVSVRRIATVLLCK